MTLGEKGNRRAILERNNYVLELFEPDEVIKITEISMDSTILGFRKMAFGVENLTSLSTEMEKQQVEIITPIEKSDFDWANQAMIVKDVDGNWTQLFEVKQ